MCAVRRISAIFSAVVCATVLVTTFSASGVTARGGLPAGHDGSGCAAPPGVTCVYGVPYASGGFVHTLDVYYPTGATGEPAVIAIHGGGWHSGSSRSMSAESIYLAQNGFAAFSINYTLSGPGQPSWPQVFDADVEVAARWVAAHAGDYGADGTKLGVLGSSAGGHLGALLDTAGHEDGIPIATDVAWSGAMDMTITYNDGDSVARSAVQQLFGCTPTECPNRYVDASPDAHVASGIGSMLFFNSSDELVPVRGAYAMNKALADAGVPHTLYVFKSSTKHAKDYECDLARVRGQTLTVIDDSVRWLALELLGTSITPTGTFCP